MTTATIAPTEPRHAGSTYAGPTYADPVRGLALADCYFYHSTAIPGHGRVAGEWDLAPGIDAYLGRVPLAGRSVLDVGAATGFLTFHMEKAGARVTSYDLSEAEGWDIVPLSAIDAAEHARGRRAHIKAINNGYWLCHEAHRSAARMAHGTVYRIDPALGPVDVSVFGSILLHLRDPFLALHNAAQVTSETMVVADLLPLSGLHSMALSRMANLVSGRAMRFKPRWARPGPWETWWDLPPRLVVEVLGVLGFERASVTTHSQLLGGKPMPMYTVVAQRTRPTVPLDL